MSNESNRTGGVEQRYFDGLQPPPDQSSKNGRQRSRRSNDKPKADVAEIAQLLTAAMNQINRRLDELENKIAEISEAIIAEHVEKEYYTTAEAAHRLGKRPYTVREWCRLERVNAQKSESGRGIDEEWRISHEELLRIQNEGLLPPKTHF